MNNSEIFKAAHKLAKAIKNKVGSYKDALAKALSAMHRRATFYKKMAHRISFDRVELGAGSSSNSHNFFIEEVQYRIVFKSVDTKVNYCGYYPNDND